MELGRDEELLRAICKWRKERAKDVIQSPSLEDYLRQHFDENPLSQEEVEKAKDLNSQICSGVW